MLSVDKSLQLFLNSFSRRRRSSSHGSTLLKKPKLAYLHQRRRSLPGRVSLNKLLHRDKQSKYHTIVVLCFTYSKNFIILIEKIMFQF